MGLAEKLKILRNKNRLSQEELAENLGISRQAISKWESGQATPDLKKLIAIAELYNVTIDSLVKDGDELDILQRDESKSSEEFISSEEDEEEVENKKTQVVININGGSIYSRYSLEYEYKSKRSLFGLPLLHINIGRGFKKAKGIVAIGNIAYGIISLGFISFGILSCGFLAIGLFALAILSIGLLLAVGVISVGTFSIGAISIGFFSLGALSIGKYSVGAAAIASDIAIGDYAKAANIAIGNNVDGINTLSLDVPIEEVRNLIQREYPNLSEWIIKLILKLMRIIK